MSKIFSAEFRENQHPFLSEFRARLEKLGYELISHADGQELLQEIKSSKPDLVILDPSLPNQSGYKVCESLKNDPETENIPVIFMNTQPGSPSLGNATLVKSFESGATDFISVATESTEVVARVQAAIRNKQIAAQASTLASELSQMNTELYERNLQVEKELYVTRQLQQSLLPPFLKEENAPPQDEAIGSFAKCHYKDDCLKISGIYLPCDALGGDIYDVINFPGGNVGVAIADVSGHGVPAGFITAMFKSSLYRTTHNHSAPNDVLYHLNNEMADMVKTGEYVTAVYCNIQPLGQDGKRQLQYSGAGHPYPYYYRAAEDRVTALKENGTPLVWVKNMEYPLGQISLEPGDKVLLFTDGITEMRNTNGDLYGDEALEALFLELIHQSQRQQTPILDEIIQTLSDFTQGHPLEDDLSIVLIEAD
jgi:sigma-B regulation protein RsbU (phosphoserine phosphatase)